VLNTLGYVDQATGFVRLCARHRVDLQAFKGPYIFVICFRFLSSTDRSLAEKILTLTRTA
jgi:hypothetical protein